MHEKTSQSINKLERALARLKEAIDGRQNEIDGLYIDGTIQRFEFCFELFWKTLRYALLDNGLDVESPREALRKAFAIHWIQNEKLWVRMLQGRNRARHVYEEETAREIFVRIPGYYELMMNTLIVIQKMM